MSLTCTATSHVDCGTNSVFNLTSQVTLMCWVKVPDWSVRGGFISKWRTATTTRQYLLYSYSNTSIRFGVNQSDDTSLYHTPVLSTLDVNTWYHVAGVANGSSMLLYLNGVAQGSPTSYDGTIKSNAATKVHIGKLRDDDDVYSLVGTIAEASIWNTALTGNQIKSYMHKRLNGGEPNLMGYWPINDAGTGTSVSVKDLTGGGSSGTMVGFAGDPWGTEPPVSK